MHDPAAMNLERDFADADLGRGLLAEQAPHHERQDLPLPTWLLDLLLTLNITVSVTLLMMAIYVPDALRFSSFPTPGCRTSIADMPIPWNHPKTKPWRNTGAPWT